jgi:hypothetical protein
MENKNRKRKNKDNKSLINVVEISPTILVITLSVSDLNITIKGDYQKARPNYMLSTKTYFKIKTYGLSAKE